MTRNDDFHHSAMVALTGQNLGYFSDYSGKPQEFISAAKYGFLYQGQALSWRKLCGTAAFGISAEAFVCSIETTTRSRTPGPGDRPRFRTFPKTLPRDHRASSARTVDTIAVSGPGIWRVQSLSIFRGRRRCSRPRCDLAKVALNCWRHFYH